MFALAPEQKQRKRGNLRRERQVALKEAFNHT